jgi:hypothetical protein
MHLPRTLPLAGSGFARAPADFAALGLVGEPLFRVKLLFSRGKDKILTTFAAHQHLVFEHPVKSLTLFKIAANYQAGSMLILYPLYTIISKLKGRAISGTPYEIAGGTPHYSYVFLAS